jgi:cytochrome c-type biogenesis protein CcmF
MSWYGMLLAHVGVAVFIVGVTLVKGYEVERDVKMEPGDTSEVAGYQYKFMGVTAVPGPNYTADRGQIEVTRDGSAVTTLYPEKRRYAASGQVMTEASIDWGFTRDLYVSLGEPIASERGVDAWAVRIYHKPFVNWIWLGCLIMAIGGMFAVVDKRYRASKKSPVAVGAVDTRKGRGKTPFGAARPALAAKKS